MNKSAIEHYSKLITGSEDMTGDCRRIWYYVGDNFLIEVSRCDHDLASKNDLMNVWEKAGYIKKSLPTHINVKTYFTDCNGNCWGYYNITEKDGKVNFDYLREWSEDNINELLAECIKLREMDIE